MSLDTPPVVARRDNSELYRQVCLLVAAVALVFSLVVLALLINNTIQARWYDPLTSARLIAVKAELAKDPFNTELSDQVTVLDQYVRQRYFTARYQAVVGFYVLLGGVAVMFAALHLATVLRRTIPFPLGLKPAEAWLQTALNRRAFVMSGIVLVAAMVMLAVLSRHDAVAAYVQTAQQAGPADVYAETLPNMEPELTTPTTTPDVTTPPAPPNLPSFTPPPPSTTPSYTPPSTPPNMGPEAPPPPPGPSGGMEPPRPPGPPGHGGKNGPGPKPGTKPEDQSGIKPLTSDGAAATGGPAVADLAKNWHVFRGPFAGIAGDDKYPTTWDGISGKNVLWKTPVPLKAPNSPIYWGGKLFMTGADVVRRDVYCFSADTGKMLWKKPVEVKGSKKPEPPQVTDETGYAAPTMTTDGQRVFAIIANGDIAAFDFDGKSLWMRNLGVPQNPYGHASSLALYKNLVLIQLDQGGDASEKLSSLIAVNVETGKTIYRTPRPVPACWSSPLVINTGTRDEAILCGNPYVVSYDPATGKELWRVECLMGDIAPSPCFAGGLVIVAQEGAGVVAVRPPGSDGGEAEVAWTLTDWAPDTVSPVSDGKLVWIVSSSGMLVCLDLKTGEKQYEHDLGMPCEASPVIVGTSLYVTDTAGVTHICGTGPEFKSLGSGKLGEGVRATPVLLEGRVYLRGDKNLFAVGAK